MDDKLRSTGPSPSVAKSPFDDTSADVVLRSSDHLDFYVHKLILSLASPFFKDMFSLNQPSIAHDTIPPAPHSNPHPIIPVTESGFTLDYILRFIYPVAEPSPPTTSTQVDHILEASMKYEIEKSALKMKEALLTFIESEPITVFVIACRLVLEDEAGAAATALKSLKPASIVMCPISHVPIDACNRGCRNWCNNFDASGRPLTCGCHEFHGYPIPIEGDSPREFALTIESAIFTKEMENMPAGPYFRLLRYIKDKDHPLTLCFPPPSARVYTTKVDIPPWRRIDADIILESRDGIQLPVHRLILSLVSAKEILDNPQSSSSVEGGLPVICLDEDAITLHILLRLCYPFPEEGGTIDLQQLVLAREAAEKYNIPQAASLARDLMARQTKQHPLRVHFLAKQHGWEKDVEDATRECLGLDPLVFHQLYAPEMETSPARVYYELLKLHHAAWVGRRNE